jgi:D-aminoacyl-tRNA deacylase
MKVVLQRVQQASVEVSGKVVGQIAGGLLLFVGITHDDTEKDVDWLVEKILKLRLFSDGGGSFMEKNVVEAEGSVLLVSQFTLYGDCKKGTRPSFTEAAPPALAEELYEYMIRAFLEKDIHTEVGKFGEHMEINLINDGPVTLILESKKTE